MQAAALRCVATTISILTIHLFGAPCRQISLGGSANTTGCAGSAAWIWFETLELFESLVQAPLKKPTVMISV
jgi:hypothetical protein